MKALKDKVNTVPPGGDYPYGDLRDNPGDNSGTPVNRDLMGDIHRTVEKIMDEAGIVANGLDDNEANGYQIYEAMRLAFRPYKSIVLSVNFGTFAITVHYTDFPSAILTLDGQGFSFEINSSEGIFTSNKTICTANSTNVQESLKVWQVNTNRVGVFKNTGTPNALIEIRVYP